MATRKPSNGVLRKLRQDAGMSRKEMAAALGRTQSGLRTIELYYTEETPSYKTYLQSYRGAIAEHSKKAGKQSSKKK